MADVDASLAFLAAKLAVIFAMRQNALRNNQPPPPYRPAMLAAALAYAIGKGWGDHVEARDRALKAAEQHYLRHLNR